LEAKETLIQRRRVWVLSWVKGKWIERVCNVWLINRSFALVSEKTN